MIFYIEYDGVILVQIANVEIFIWIVLQIWVVENSLQVDWHAVDLYVIQLGLVI